MKNKKSINTTTTDLSTISSKYELHADSETNNLIILIELEYPQFLTAYIDVIENFVKSYGKNYKNQRLPYYKGLEIGQYVGF